jgi:transcriptional regulator with XRE-family HTH domain
MSVDKESRTMPKLMLGKKLRTLREEARASIGDIAELLDLTPGSVRRFEKGDTVVASLALRVLCDHFNVDAETRERLVSMRTSADQPPWWRPLGPRPDATATWLELEDAATRIRSFNLTWIPGLLQIPEYARAVMQSVEPDISRQQLDKAVELRMTRQTRVFGRGQREIAFVIDETALRKLPGSVETRRAQLGALRTPREGTSVLILPDSNGPHPGAGAFTIFDVDIDDDLSTQAAHVEWASKTKGVIEEGDDVQPFIQVWERLKTLALKPRESSQFVKRMMERISDE